MATDFLGSVNHFFLPFWYTPRTANIISPSSGNEFWNVFRLAKVIFWLVETLFYLFFRYFCHWFTQIPYIYLLLVYWKCIFERNSSFWPLETGFQASGNHFVPISQVSLSLKQFFTLLEICFKRIRYYCQWRRIFCLLETISFHSDFSGNHYCNWREANI